MVGEKEFTFQTDERILKRARKEPEQEFLEGKQPNSEEGFYLINELYNKVDFLKEEMEKNERK